MEQELQELRAVISTLVEQLRIQNEALADKDAQIAALTEQVAKLTARIEELMHKKNSNNSSKPPSEGDWRNLLLKAFAGRAEKSRVDNRVTRELE